MSTIPLAEITAVATSHRVSLTGLPEDVTVAALRDVVHFVRDETDRMPMGRFEEAVQRKAVRDTAKDLAALADRYEQETP